MNGPSFLALLIESHTTVPIDLIFEIGYIILLSLTMYLFSDSFIVGLITSILFAVLGAASFIIMVVYMIKIIVKKHKQKHRSDNNDL
jgi:uncharacterized membrane-anchored protein